MAELILGLGESGVGKTTSLRNLDPKKTVIVTPNSKSLPFQGGAAAYIEGTNLIRTNDITKILDVIRHVSTNLPHVNVLVIDDFFHFISTRVLSPTFIARTKGNDAFAKWNELGSDIYNNIFAHAIEMRPDLYVVLLAHSDIKEDGTVGIKTAGKLLDNTIEIPSHCTYVFHFLVKDTDDGVQYLVQTNRNSIYQAKSPMGSFPDLYIGNDLNAIINRINEYRFGTAVK